MTFFPNLSNRLENWWLVIDLALLLQFAVVHSWLLTNKGRQSLGRLGQRSLQGTFYALISSLSLLLTFLCWQRCEIYLYRFDGALAKLLLGLYGLSWLFMGWAMLATGALKQAGIEQWFNTLRDKPTRYEDPRGGPYRYMRHPIYFGMIGMISFSPTMTYSHLLLAVVWTAYMIVGAMWKENRMAARAGNYKQYMYQVPAFPFFPRRPLANLV